jgi:hypothetical protein
MRTLLCKKNYWDLDMVKCHVMICLNIAKRYNLALPALERYVDCPDDVLQELSDYYLGASKNACKQLVNSVLNRGTVGGWVAKQEQKYLMKGTSLLPSEARTKIKYGGVVNKAVLDMMTDFKMGKQIMDKVSLGGNASVIQEFESNIRELHMCMKQEFPGVFEFAISTIKSDAKLRDEYQVGEDGDDERMERKAFSDCLFEVENRLLNAIVRSLQAQGFRVDAKVHDGCHVWKTEGMETIPAEVIGKVVADVKRETRFDIKLKVKEMEELPIPKIKKTKKHHDQLLKNAGFQLDIGTYPLGYGNLNVNL